MPGATWFFTINLAQRQHNNLLLEHVALLCQSFRYVMEKHPLKLNDVVVLPEHLHCIGTLPPGDADFSMRWDLLKGHFFYDIKKDERISNSRLKRRERGIWLRRFWEHKIRDEEDLMRHLDYIHWNPVKHGYVTRVAD